MFAVVGGPRRTRELSIILHRKADNLSYSDSLKNKHVAVGIFRLAGSDEYWD
jgi:hypothetical protein